MPVRMNMPLTHGSDTAFAVEAVDAVEQVFGRVGIGYHVLVGENVVRLDVVHGSEQVAS